MKDRNLWMKKEEKRTAPGLKSCLLYTSGICFAVHMIFLDRFTAYCTPIRLTVMQMGTAAACSWVLGLLTEGAFHPEVFTLPGVAVSMLYLGLASSMLCFCLLYTSPARK